MNEEVEVGDLIEITKSFRMHVMSPETGDLLTGNVCEGEEYNVTKVLEAFSVVQAFDGEDELWIPFTAFRIFDEAEDSDLGADAILSFDSLVKRMANGHYEDGTRFRNTSCDNSDLELVVDSVVDEMNIKHHYLVDGEGFDIGLDADLFFYDWYIYKEKPKSYYFKNRGGLVSKEQMKDIFSAFDEGELDLLDVLYVIEVDEEGNEEVRSDLFY